MKQNTWYACAVVLLLILLSFSTGYATSIEKTNTAVDKLPMDERVSYKKDHTLTRINHDFMKIPTDVPVTMAEEDESNPNLVIDIGGNPFVVFDKNYDLSLNVLGFRYSPSGGEDWPDEYYFEFGIEESYMTNPQLTLLSDGIGCIGSYNDFIAPTPDENFFTATDITDPDTYEFRYWDNSGSSNYILETSSTVTPEDILCFATISDYDTGEEYMIDTFSAHWHLNPSFDYIGGVIFYNTDSEGRSQPLSNMVSDAGDKVYFCAEQEKVDGSKIIRAYYCDVDETTQYTDWRTSPVAGGNGNCTNPDLSVSGRQAYCVYMDDRDGNQDVYVATTTSGGFWMKYKVAGSEDDELYPVISANGDKATCMFMKNNNLYVTNTEDGGKTWSDPIMANDEDGTVVEAYGNADIDSGAGVWTSNSLGNQDLFFDEVGSAPVISIDALGGGFGISATVSNVGNAPAEEIPWAIDVNGTMFLGAHVEGTISLAAESTDSISTGFVLGIGSVDISVSVGDKAKSAEAFVLGPFVFLK